MHNVTGLLTNGEWNSSGIERSRNSTETDDYDHVGAMQFIIVTVLVYSTIGVCCTLVVRIRRSQTHKSHPLHVQDEHIQKYLKSEKYLKDDGFKMKLAFECDRTRGRLDELEGKARLLDIQKSVTYPDFAGTSEKGKKKDKKKSRKTRLDSLVGKIGFSLILVPEMNDVKAEEFEMKHNGYVTNSTDSSISETPSHSMTSILEVPVLKKSSSFLSVEQLHLSDDVFPSSFVSCASSDNSLDKTLTQVGDISFTEITEENQLASQT